MDMSVHSWQICVKKMCISKGISYIRQMQKTYTKVLHEIYPNVTKVFPCFFCFVFFAGVFFRITFDLLLTTWNTSRLDTLKYTNQPIWLWFLLMISCQTDHKFEYGMLSLTRINQLTVIDLNMLARICRQQWILFYFYFFVIFRFFFA